MRDPAARRSGFAVSTYFDSRINQLPDDAGNVFGRDALMHEQLFGGIADRRTLSFRVDHDRICHIEIGGASTKM